MLRMETGGSEIMAKVLVSKFAVEFTMNELFMLRILLRRETEKQAKDSNADLKEKLSWERLYDDLNIDKYR